MRTDITPDAHTTAWRNPVIRLERVCQAPAEIVYDLLAGLENHLDWAGRRQGKTTRLLTMTAPPGPAVVGTEFRTTGSDGARARWSDRSVVTEATRPEIFEFVTEGRREGKPGADPWLATATHRYAIVPVEGGCRLTYTEDLSRLDGAPWPFRTPVMNRLVFSVSAKLMRRGFDGLIALAEERARTER